MNPIKIPICVTSKLLLKLSCIFISWITLSTIMPNYLNLTSNNNNSLLSPQIVDKDGYLTTTSYYTLNSNTIITHNLINSDIVLITAHPDDESMFFSPSLIELSKLNYNNKIHIICFTNGGFNDLGPIRERELEVVGKMLNLEHVKVLDYVDDGAVDWGVNDVVSSLQSELMGIDYQRENVVLLSFDEGGVSDHANHKSLYFGVLEFMKLKMKLGGEDNEAGDKNVSFFKLNSWPIYTKYSTQVLTNFELLIKYLQKALKFEFKYDDQLNLLNKFVYGGATDGEKSVMIYSDFYSWFVGLSAMTYGHYSQIVWFRWIWLFSSKYMNSNELILVDSY